MLFFIEKDRRSSAKQFGHIVIDVAKKHYVEPLSREIYSTLFMKVNNCRSLQAAYKQAVDAQNEEMIKEVFDQITQSFVKADPKYGVLYQIFSNFYENGHYQTLYKTTISKIKQNILSQDDITDEDYFKFFLLMNEFMFKNGTATKFDDHRGKKIKLNMLGYYLYQMGYYVMGQDPISAQEYFYISYMLDYQKSLVFLIPISIYCGCLGILEKLLKITQNQFIKLILDGNHEGYEQLLDQKQDELIAEHTYIFYVRGMLMAEINRWRATKENVNNIEARAKYLIIGNVSYEFTDINDYFQPQQLQLLSQIENLLNEADQRELRKLKHKEI